MSTSPCRGAAPVPSMIVPPLRRIESTPDGTSFRVFRTLPVFERHCADVKAEGEKSFLPALRLRGCVGIKPLGVRSAARAGGHDLLHELGDLRFAAELRKQVAHHSRIRRNSRQVHIA